MYLAVKKEEAINYPKKYLAQFGYGLRRDGQLRIPEEPVNGPIIIDDAIAGTWSEDALKELAGYCKNGYILDFERPFSEGHRRLMAALPPEKLLAIPANCFNPRLKGLPVLACPSVCNSWLQFLENSNQKFPRGWALEITPWKLQKKSRPGESSGFLLQSLCRYTRSGGIVTYYDTRETLCKKLKLARDYRCRAAIAVLEEVRPLRK